MKDSLKTIIWLIVYGFIFGNFVSQGVFYLFDREPTGLIFFLSVAIFFAIGGVVFFFYGLLETIDEGGEILRYRIQMLEEKVEDLESDMLAAKLSLIRSESIER